MRRLAGLALAATLSACSVKQVDPCADVAGSCLSLRVTGSGHVDTLDIVASNAFSGTMTSTFAKGDVSLPVRVAVVPKAGASGLLDLTVRGASKGSFVGAGSTSVQLTGTDDRQEIEVELSRSDLDGSANADGGSDGGLCAPGEGLSCSDPSTLVACDADGGATTTTACALGCSTTGTPHCAVLVPHAPLTSAMITSAPAQGIVAITGSVVIDTDTGLILGLRDANQNPMTSQVIAGIEFHVIDDATSVFSAQGFTFASASSALVVGSRPLMMVATETIEIDGLIDARQHADVSFATCSGSGGGAGSFAGGSASTPKGGGPGGGQAGVSSGQASASSGGGAGGGNGTVGGAGGAGYQGGVATAGGKAGVAVPITFPILGGSGGGAGTGGGQVGGQGGSGGAGGGAVHLVAGTSITLFGGNAPGGILASGCYGTPGSGAGSPGGGGAGGTVVLESPTVTFGPNGAVAVNGGGGAGGDPASPAESGLLDEAVGGGAYDAANGMASAGGYGAGNTQVDGTAGFSDSTTTLNGGGGGGGGGYVQLFSRAGSVTITSPAFVSPASALTNGTITSE